MEKRPFGIDIQFFKGDLWCYIIVYEVYILNLIKSLQTLCCKIKIGSCGYC